MIVDAHVHLNDGRWRPKAFKRGLGRIISASLAKYSGEFADPDELIKGADEQFTDPDGKLLLADMDEAGVDVSVITTVDYAMGDDEPCSGTPYCEPVSRVNHIFGELAKRHPKRLVHLVNPTTTMLLWGQVLNYKVGLHSSWRTMLLMVV